MRRFGAAVGLGSVTQYLIVANALVYAIQLLNQPPASGGGPFSALSLRSISWVEHTFSLVVPLQSPDVIWQIVTSMFLHGSLFHIAINMFILWQFGNILERVWGSERFLKYYFFVGIGAGVMTALVGALTAGYTNPACVQAMGDLPWGCFQHTLGASGAIMGVLLAFAMLFPNQQLMLLFPPIPIKAKYLVVIIAAVSIFAQVTGALPGIGHITHLGGFAFGLLYFKGPVQIRRLLS